MPRYFFNLRDADFCTSDHTGNDFDSLEGAEVAALRVIENLRSERPAWLAGLLAPFIEIANSDGEVLSSLPFPQKERVVN